jgi:thiosulfate reductase cytochrome b subunit
MIWTGLAMSPAVEGAFPSLVIALGGRQSARTIHFFVTIFLVLFLLAHVLMVYLAGFRERVGAMIVGRVPERVEPEAAVPLHTESRHTGPQHRERG